MSILAVGSIALDSIKTPFGQTSESLGGSAVHFSAAASFFSPLHLLGVVGEDFPQEQLFFLKKRGVDLAAVQIQKGKTFRWSGEYGFDLNDAKTLDTQLNVFADFAPVVPDKLKDVDHLFLGNIHPSLQINVLKQIKKLRSRAGSAFTTPFVSIDTMNFWIEREPELLRKAISMADLVVINEREARELTKRPFLLTAALKIQSWGPKTVVIKRGENGAFLFHGKHVFSAPGLPLEKVKDPTGAGDSFAGGLIGYLAASGKFDIHTLRKAVIVGSTMASFNVEEFSCTRLMGLTYREIDQRIKAFQKLSHFEEIQIRGNFGRTIKKRA